MKSHQDQIHLKFIFTLQEEKVYTDSINVHIKYHTLVYMGPSFLPRFGLLVTLSFVFSMFYTDKVCYIFLIENG